MMNYGKAAYLVCHKDKWYINILQLCSISLQQTVTAELMLCNLKIPFVTFFLQGCQIEKPFVIYDWVFQLQLKSRLH